ncbi:hypothetical protein ACFU7Y_09245 [Kitasatospora sp. NPDC057542]|uniref:hypothetical protein n=1 Tax=Kitasatospora sp. NPDC057542 TaxID=3346162 RepID=UPI0036A62E6D
MTVEDVRQEYRAWTPTPQLPKLAPPIDRTGRTGGALGDVPGVEADSFWSVLKTALPIAASVLL